MNPLRGHHIRWSAVAGCRALAGGRPLAWLVIPAAQSAPSDPSNAQGVSIQTGGAGDGESFIADSYYSGASSGPSTDTKRKENKRGTQSPPSSAAERRRPGGIFAVAGLSDLSSTDRECAWPAWTEACD